MVATNPRARPDLIPVGRFVVVEEVADVAVLLAMTLGVARGESVLVLLRREDERAVGPPC